MLALLCGGELAYQHAHLLVDVRFINCGLRLNFHLYRRVTGKLELGLHQHGHVEAEHLVRLRSVFRFNTVGGNRQRTLLFQREGNQVVDYRVVNGRLAVFFAQRVIDLFQGSIAFKLVHLVLNHECVKAIGKCLAHFSRRSRNAQAKLFAVIFKLFDLHRSPFQEGRNRKRGSAIV